ncbi:hypothetical protein SBA4_1970003 [Candidatus Sulfopaludibacter sp. SbA4]|nr:hypothetical protein SBA4_1970003 [Candidatus Sulfopaludibacter sp. SbA4]
MNPPRAIAEDLWRRQLGPDNPFLLENPTTRKVGKEAWERESVWGAKIPELPGSKGAFAKPAPHRVPPPAVFIRPTAE